jgi:hypothetical protein
MADERDERLGTLLSELEVPEHGPEFWADLERLLADAAPAGVAPELPQRRFPIATPGSLGRRVPRPPRREPRARIPRLGFAFAAVAVIAAVAIVAIRSATVSTEPARAAEIIRRALDVIGSVEGLSGTLRLESIGEEGPPKTFVDRWQFLITDDGSFRLEQLVGEGREEYALDGRTGVVHDLSIPPPPFGGGFALRSEGAPLGGPDPGVMPDILRRDIGASALTYLDEDDTRVTETSFDGRPAYQLDSDVDYVGSQDGRVRALIDRDSGLPVEVTIFSEGGFVSEFSLHDLRFDPPVSGDEFTVDFPPGVPRQNDDLGFRRIDLEQAARRAGYEPPVPSYVPEGFELGAVGVRVPDPEDSCIERCDAGIFPTPTGLMADNPVAGPIVALAYRDGLRQFTITARPTGPRPGLWENPFFFETTSLGPERLSLGSGTLAGAHAEVVISPVAEPHLWALGDELVVTVNGSLSRDDLVRVAESLGV